MDINCLEIKFSKVGINSIPQGKNVAYIPVIVIQYDGVPKKKRIYLSELVDDKRAVDQIIATQSFISLRIKKEYKFFNMEGTFLGIVSIDKYGTLLQVDDDSIVLLKGTTATRVSNKAEILETRQLTEEELKEMKD